jgi:hypothetical protein
MFSLILRLAQRYGQPDKSRFGTDEPGTGFSATVC